MDIDNYSSSVAVRGSIGYVAAATEIVDSAIFNGEDEQDTERMRDCIASVLTVGVACLMELPWDRMGMAEVLKELHKIRARSIAGGGNSLALGSVRSPLKARNPTKAAGFLSCKSMSTNLPTVQVKEKIDLTEKETMIFDRLLATIRHFDLSIELRVGGDWVRNKEFHAIAGDSANPYLITTAMTFSELRLSHVSVLVKGWIWIPDNLDNLYPCRRGLSCLWTKSPVLADKLDALLFQTSTPPLLVFISYLVQSGRDFACSCQLDRTQTPVPMEKHAAIMFLFYYAQLPLWTSFAMQTNQTDRLALIYFRDSVHGDPLRVLSSWNDSSHHCEWQGVVCSGRHPGRVVSLNLTSKGLGGLLSPHVGNLSFLRSLVLQNNSFRRNSTNLWAKFLSRLFAKASSFRFGWQQSYRIYSPSVGNLSQLYTLYVSENGLQEEIPETLSKLRGLESVELAFNQLTGEIPPAIFNISGIFFFSVLDNQLRGSIPPYIGYTLPHLIYLNFGSNLFTGVIPPSLSNASGLQKIYFQTNSFHGQLPANLGRLKALEKNARSF
ncbi:hypothetical protein NL676_028062 [Syzygium grande]|nr:hypothetical protein NL676_028062 [Syzygium grande]